MSDFVSVIKIVLFLLLVIGYIIACISVKRIASYKGHNISTAVCVVFGLPYIIYVLSLPDLGKRSSFTIDFPIHHSSLVNSKRDSKVVAVSIVLAVALAVVSVFGSFGEKRTIELVEIEYSNAVSDIEYTVVNSEYGRDAELIAMYGIVTSVERSEENRNEYIAVLEIKCGSSKYYSSSYYGQLLKQLNGLLVAYEILDRLPSSIKLKNGKQATLWCNGMEMVYIYVDGDLVYYPGYTYTG